MARQLFTDDDDEDIATVTTVTFRGHIDVDMRDEIVSPFHCPFCLTDCPPEMRVEVNCGGRHFACAACMDVRCNHVSLRGLTCHYCNTELTLLTCFSAEAFEIVCPRPNQ